VQCCVSGSSARLPSSDITSEVDLPFEEGICAGDPDTSSICHRKPYNASKVVSHGTTPQRRAKINCTGPKRNAHSLVGMAGMGHTIGHLHASKPTPSSAAGGTAQVEYTDGEFDTMAAQRAVLEAEGLTDHQGEGGVAGALNASGLCHTHAASVADMGVGVGAGAAGAGGGAGAGAGVGAGASAGGNISKGPSPGRDLDLGAKVFC
jgi:hypothetical protein